jgi:hypothetical protein
MGMAAPTYYTADMVRQMPDDGPARNHGPGRPFDSQPQGAMPPHLQHRQVSTQADKPRASYLVLLARPSRWLRNEEDLFHPRVIPDPGDVTGYHACDCRGLLVQPEQESGCRTEHHRHAELSRTLGKYGVAVGTFQVPPGGVSGNATRK